MKASAEKINVVTRHCQDGEGHSQHSGDDTFNDTINEDDCNNDIDINCDLNVRKKMRSVDPPVPAVSPDKESEATTSPPRQWWFSRTTNDKMAAAVRQEQHNSSMVLSEHLGRTSDVVESLTHDVKNWSLTRLEAASNTNVSRKKEKQRKCKDAQRQVRMARRQCLEAQHQQQQRLVTHDMDWPTATRNQQRCVEFQFTPPTLFSKRRKKKYSHLPVLELQASCLIYGENYNGFSCIKIRKKKVVLALTIRYRSRLCAYVQPIFWASSNAWLLRNYKFRLYRFSKRKRKRKRISRRRRNVLYCRLPVANQAHEVHYDFFLRKYRKI